MTRPRFSYEGAGAWRRHGRRCARVLRDGLRRARWRQRPIPADAAVTFQSAVVTNPATWTSLYGSWPALRYDHGWPTTPT